MNSSQDHDGPSGQGRGHDHGHGHEQELPSDTSTSIPTTASISTKPPDVSAPAPAPATAPAPEPAPPAALATAPTSHDLPPQLGGENPVEDGLPPKMQGLEASAGNNLDGSSMVFPAEASSLNFHGMPLPNVDSLIGSASMADLANMQGGVLDHSQIPYPLAAFIHYNETANSGHYDDPNGVNLPPEVILESMRNQNSIPSVLQDIHMWDHLNSGAPPDEQAEMILDGEEDVPSRAQGYGKLHLPDTEHWITSRTVLIGRDLKLYKHLRTINDHEQLVRDHEAKGLPPPEPPRSAHKYKGSYVSKEGGALGPGIDDDRLHRPSKRRKTGRAKKSPGRQKDGANGGENVVSSRQYVEHSRPVDVDTLRPSDEVVGRLDIHGAGPDYPTMFQNTKGISREHLKIQYNRDKRIWEAHVLGRNGVFHRDHTQSEDEFLHHMVDTVFTLRSGDVLQIQKVEITFSLNDVEDGKTGAELPSTYSENGKEMSFDFQSSRGDEMRDTDDSSDDHREEAVAEEARAERAVVDSDDSDDSDEEMEDAPSLDKGVSRDLSNSAADEIRETVESDPPDETMKLEPSLGEADTLAQVPLPPKKRGPGRPPKNGIMSKREERLLKKQAQEEAKKNMPPQEPGEQPQKRKVGRPRKHPLPEDADGQSEKRKYKARRSKGEEGDDEVDGEKPAKEKSQKHKTPPLELKREDFTEEQLQKPTKNYQMLIDEIMTAAPPKGYSLKQVYKRIQERWPFFYFCVDTKGWESSVRHNLLGSECFKKIDGNWHRVPGVPLESGKKRKPSDATAEPRATPMYNGYNHPYHPPPHAQPHGHQPMAHSTGLSQPNLPPRYPPNGQAYQILHPPPNPAQPGMQAAPRPGFPQQQTIPPAPQANGYATAGAPPRPHFQGNQPPPYNSVYGNRPQPPHVAPTGVPGSTAGQNPAHRPPLARPGQGPSGVLSHGVQTSTSSPHAPRPAAPALTSQQPVATSAPPAPLGPVIEPALKEFIREFRAEVVKQLHAKEGKRSETVAMSVINRGLGLTERSLLPELEAYEKLILKVFHQHKILYPKARADAAARSRAASASVPPAARASGQTPAMDGNGSATPATPGAGPVTANSMAVIGTKSPATTGSSTVDSKPNQSVAPAALPATDGGPTVPTNAVAVKTAPGTAAPATAKPPSTSVQPSKPTNSVPVAPAPTPVSPALEASATNPSTAQPSIAAGPTAGTGVSTGPAPSPPTSAGPAHGAAANTASTTPKPAPSGPAPNAPVTTGATAPEKPSSTGPVNAAPGNQKPVSGGPAPSANMTPALDSPQPGGSSPATTGAPVNAAAGGGPRSATPSGAPAATATAVSGSKAALIPTATSATSDGAKNVELLDPKLVSVILAFKKTILPTLAEKLDSILGETLIMSAVDRMLGFTDETFVIVQTDLQQKNLAEAENALMKHLETRFHEYLRTRSASR